MIVLERILECVSVLFFVRKKSRLFDSIVLIIYNLLLNVDATTNSLHCHSVPNAWARRIDFQPWMILNNFLTAPFFNFHAWQLSMSNTELLKYSFVNVIQFALYLQLTCYIYTQVNLISFLAAFTDLVICLCFTTFIFECLDDTR